MTYATQQNIEDAFGEERLSALIGRRLESFHATQISEALSVGAGEIDAAVVSAGGASPIDFALIADATARASAEALFRSWNVTLALHYLALGADKSERLDERAKGVRAMLEAIAKGALPLPVPALGMGFRGVDETVTAPIDPVVFETEDLVLGLR